MCSATMFVVGGIFSANSKVFPFSSSRTTAHAPVPAFPLPSQMALAFIAVSRFSWRWVETSAYQLMQLIELRREVRIESHSTPVELQHEAVDPMQKLLIGHSRIPRTHIQA